MAFDDAADVATTGEYVPSPALATSLPSIAVRLAKLAAYVWATSSFRRLSDSPGSICRSPEWSISTANSSDTCHVGRNAIKLAYIRCVSAITSEDAAWAWHTVPGPAVSVSVGAMRQPEGIGSTSLTWPFGWRTARTANKIAPEPCARSRDSACAQYRSTHNTNTHTRTHA